MSLADRLVTAPAKFPNRCHVHKILTELSGDDREALQTVLADEAWTATAIQSALRDEGHKVGDDSLRRHRRGQCSCGRA